MSVACYPADNVYEGYVFFTGDSDGVFTPIPEIHLEGDYCAALGHALRNPHSRWLRSLSHSDILGYAMLAMVHEAMHIKLDSMNEGVVECTAYRNVWNYLGELNLSHRIRREVYLSSKFSHFQATGEYRSVC